MFSPEAHGKYAVYEAPYVAYIEVPNIFAPRRIVFEHFSDL